MKRLELTQGKETLLDNSDYARLRQYRWHVAEVEPGRFYARCGTVNSPFFLKYMHAVIAGCARPDHKNGDGLDNRRKNLRPSTARQNSRNMRVSIKRKTARLRTAHPVSRFKGVSWCPSSWYARIYWTTDAGVQRKYLGSFPLTRKGERAAALAYNAAAQQLFGEFACLNSI